MDYEISVLLGNQSRVPARCPLRDYLEAFVGHMKDPFLTHYDFLSGGISTNSSRSIASETYTRGGFWNLTLKCVSALMRCGVERGHKHVHYFGGNTVYDLALRLASVILGSIPVTVNWQADNFDLVCYKIEITSAKVVFVDERTPNVEEIQSRFPNVKIVTTENIACTISYGGNFTDISTTNGASYVGYEDTRCIIFTSGTTGRPKGVELTYSNYHCNRATFESFLGLTDEDVRFIPIVVNPMHHTNSTSITDWALRRPGSHVHLLDRYTTQYWDVLIQVHAGLRGDVDDTSGASVDGRSYRVIAPLVSRHIDFLDSLMQSGHFADAKELTSSLCLSTLLLGSAPVGPTTCHRLMKHAGHLPTVRFGSTETTLQVCGIPHELSDDAIMAAFERGWNHTVNKSHAPPSACPAAKTSEIPAITEASPGYYIGRDHFPFTEVRVVASVNPEDSDNYLKECPEGVPGYLITRGGHVFKRYVGVSADVTDRVCSSSTDRQKERLSLGSSESTNAVIEPSSTIDPADRWYLNLGDMGFWLRSHGSHGDSSRQRDLYWQTRDSHMLIKGGSNYAYEQIISELTAFISRRYGLPASGFSLAVVGLRVPSMSEHDDQCCVMLQLRGTESGGSSSSSSSSNDDLPPLSDEQLACIAMSGAHPQGASSTGAHADALVGATVNADTPRSLRRQWEALLQATFVSFANASSAGISKGAKPAYFAVVDSIPMVASKGVTDAPAVARYFRERL